MTINWIHCQVVNNGQSFQSPENVNTSLSLLLYEPRWRTFLHYIVVWPTMSCFADWSKCRRCWLYRSIQWFLPTSFSLFTPIDYWATDNINSELPYLSISAVQQAIHPFSEFYDNPSITVLFSFFILFTDRQTDKRRWKQYVIPAKTGEGYYHCLVLAHHRYPPSASMTWKDWRVLETVLVVAIQRPRR